MTFFNVFTKKKISHNSILKARPITAKHGRRIRRSRRTVVFA